MHRFMFVVLVAIVSLVVLGLRVINAPSKQACFQSKELAALRGGQVSNGYPVGPGGPCANGMSYLCEEDTPACVDSTCNVVGGRFVCDTFDQRVQAIPGWTVCSSSWPFGTADCVARIYYCTTLTVCNPNSLCEPDPDKGGKRYCSLGTLTYGANQHNGGQLTGNDCP